MVGREVIGAHYGWRGWLMQRVTAVVMLVYTLLLLATILKLPALDYDHWKALWDFCMVLSSHLTLAVLSTHKSSA